MAYWVQETGTNHNESNYKSFMCDDRTDIAKLPKIDVYGEAQDGDTVSCLPCSKSSSCFCIIDGSVWILNSKNVWVEV